MAASSKSSSAASETPHGVSADTVAIELERPGLGHGRKPLPRPLPGLVDESWEKERKAAYVAETESFFLANVDAEKGLFVGDVPELRAIWGFNEILDEKRNVCLEFLSYFWGPMPVMIWVSILVEVIKTGITGEGAEDIVVLVILQLANGVLGFYEEKNAGNAIAALKDKLKPECFVVRHGEDGEEIKAKVQARELVPGDVIELKLGDVVPADAVLLGDPENAMHQLQVDESALTGESLPRAIHAGGKLKMSSSIKQGEMKALVTGTGRHTFFGKAAELLKIGAEEGRFQKVLFKITLALMFLSIALCAIIFIILMVANDGGRAYDSTLEAHSPFLRSLSVVIVLMIASIPIATQVVCTSTLAVGSRRLAQKKVIVARLSAIEELAGMTVLCSDKTGTLTLNVLTLNDPIIFGDMSADELVFFAALSSNRGSQNMDAIDFCIVNSVPTSKAGKNPQAAAAAAIAAGKTVAPAGSGEATVWTTERLARYETTKFVPFNPVIKRTEATVRSPDGTIFQVVKGAPQIVLQMALTNPTSPPTLRDEVTASIQDLADRGYRALGIATSFTPEGEPPIWNFEGLLSIYDPPRPDTKDTIKLAMSHGVEVKMITGDQKAIAVETCRRLEMGTDIFTTDSLDDPSLSKDLISEKIFNANGFAEVMPEHKFNIVQALRERGLVVGMTGDGVNDAPALKRADIGIAVHGATDAAKAAADIVLTEPGLSVIIDAIRRARKIFQRMKNYAVYRIACTLQLLCFFFVAIIAVRPSWFYPDPTDNGLYASGCANHGSAFNFPVIALVLITVLNDGTIISVAYDKVIPAEQPQQWNMYEIVSVSLVLGFIALLSSLLLLGLAMDANCSNPGTFFGTLLGAEDKPWVTYGQVQSILYLKVSISDFLTVFASRNRSWFWVNRPSVILLLACVVATSASTLFAIFWPFSEKEGTLDQSFEMVGLQGHPYAVITIWIYCILWFVVQDAAKVLLYHLVGHLWDGEGKKEAEARSTISNLIATDQRAAVLADPKGLRARAARAMNTLTATRTVLTVPALALEVSDLRHQVRFLEDEIDWLRDALMRTRGPNAEPLPPHPLDALRLALEGGGAGHGGASSARAPGAALGAGALDHSLRRRSTQAETLERARQSTLTRERVRAVPSVLDLFQHKEEEGDASVEVTTTSSPVAASGAAAAAAAIAAPARAPSPVNPAAVADAVATAAVHAALAGGRGHSVESAPVSHVDE